VNGELQIAPERAAELLGGGAQAVDVREQYEWDAGHIGGASHIELPELTAAAAQLDGSRPIVFYCRSGERSRMAAEAFRAAGFDAYNLEGGLTAWVDKGLPIEPESGTVADHIPLP
jgi:hydroxyacylglutathione hydrolase/adenylyltransferase/sulfurtransferase